MDPFVAEIKIVGFNFAPTGYAFCDGQILPLSQNTALFALLGTTYGGNGQSNFALPNLQGRTVIHSGQGPGLSDRFLGETGGSEAVTLLESEMPAHKHTFQAVNDSGLMSSPQGGLTTRGNLYKDNPGSFANMRSTAVNPSGESLPHNNMQPYLTLNFIIALQGIFPPHP